MPRGGASFRGRMGASAVSPINLVRVLNIPAKNDPSTKISLYLTDCETDVTAYNEEGATQVYTGVALSYDEADSSTQNEVGQCRVRIDNLDSRFTALAKTAALNGVEVHVLTGFRDTVSSPDGCSVKFQGHVENCLISEHSVEAVCHTDFSLKTRIPRRLYWVVDFPHLPSSKDPRQPAVM